MRTIWQDIRFTARMLMRTPGFTFAVVLILALGIGANTAIFSVVNAVLVRPLPFRDPGCLVQIETRLDAPEFAQMLEQLTQTTGITSTSNSPFEVHEVRQRNHVFQNVAAIRPMYLVDVRATEPVRVFGAYVSAEFFPCLGIQTLLGRGFHPEEDQPGNDQVVILGYQYWKDRYGADPGIIGKAISFKEGVYTVVGVLPPNLHFLEYGGVTEAFTWMAKQSESKDIDVWKPMALTPEKSGADSMNSFGIYLFARLKPKVTLNQAQADLNVISKQLTQEYEQRGPRTWLLTPVPERLAVNVRPALWILSGTVVCVLLIVCANVTNLLLARSLGRQQEVAIRIALGAGRLRLIRQFLTESLLLSLFGGLGGVLLTIWLLGSLRASLLSRMPRLSDISVDGSVLCFTLGVSVFTAALIGLAPILRLPELGLGCALKGRAAAIRSAVPQGVLYKTLLVSEVALSLVLLIGAGLMIKSFWRFAHADLGFDPRNVLVVDHGLDVPLMDRLQQMPGVRMVAVGEPCVIPGGSYEVFGIAGQDSSVGGLKAKCVRVTKDYFAVLRIPLLAGRIFTAGDHAKAERVVIINQMIARQYFADSLPLGRILTCKGKSWQIVGVVADIRPHGLRNETIPTIYIPFSQGDWITASSQVIVRTSGRLETMLAPIRREFLAMNPLSPVPRMWTLEELLAGAVAPLRFNMELLSLFAVLALVLTAVGVYSLIAFFVSQRTQEIGIRMALGAQSGDVLKSVLRQGLKLTLIGTCIGLAGAFALTRIITSLLYDVDPTDPLTFVFVSLFLIGVAMLASYIPARRAAKIDPMEALRYE
jgi:putative ABC transport system permease protein